MESGKNRILEVLNSFTGRDGEPRSDREVYTLKAMWIMMMSEFEACIKSKVENYIDKVKLNDIKDIHVCLLTRNFFGNKNEELTLSKIISFYKEDTSNITYKNFTRDQVPKYKSKAIEKLFNNLGIFLDPADHSSILILDSMASTRDAIAHGDTQVAITRKELQENLTNVEDILTMLQENLDAH